MLLVASLGISISTILLIRYNFQLLPPYYLTFICLLFEEHVHYLDCAKFRHDLCHTEHLIHIPALQ